MEETVKRIPINKKEEKLTKKEMNELLDSLERVKAALCDAYTGFNNTLEPELIEAAVFEISALKARYTYILRIIKEQEANNVEKRRFEKTRRRKER